GFPVRKQILLVTSAVVALALPPLAGAQATRTWVSGVGDDANPCSRTAPCKTFAGAISKTAANGIINALDPGGFGALTITKPISIIGPPAMAHILGTGTNGINININPPSSHPVILRNIEISGTAATDGSYGLNGINFIAGRDLRLEHVKI